MATDMPTYATAVDHYRCHGYTILRNVFNPRKIASLRDECRVKGQSTYIGPRDFNGLLLSEKLIEPLRPLLGPRIVLFGDSSSKSKQNPLNRRFTLIIADFRLAILTIICQFGTFMSATGSMDYACLIVPIACEPKSTRKTSRSQHTAHQGTASTRLVSGKVSVPA